MLKLKKKKDITESKKEIKDLDLGVIGIAQIASIIANIVSEIYKRIGGNKKDEKEIIDFIKNFKYIDLKSEMNKYLKIIETWILNLVNKLIPLISTLLITTIFDSIEKIIIQLKDSKTMGLIDEFLIICIRYATRNTPRIIKFLMFFIRELFESILELPLICIKDYFKKDE